MVQSWIDNMAYSHSQSNGTEYAYRHILKVFCDFIEKTPEEIIEEYETMTTEHGFRGMEDFKRKYAQNIMHMISKMLKKDFTRGTIGNRVNTIKSFFKYNNLPLAHISVSKNRVTYHNRDITKKEIVSIIEVARPRDRAFFCMMAQSGLRPSTLCSLQLKQIQPDFKDNVFPCCIQVPEDMTKGEYKSYFTFMGEESVKYLRRYLMTRHNLTPESYVFASYSKIGKPLNTKTISKIFAQTIEKLKQKGVMSFEQKKKGRPRTVRLYNLRKFFRKHAHQAGFEIVQFWMGHTVKEGVDEHYRPKDVEFHRALYKEKAVPHLRLESPTATETDKVIEHQAQQIKELQKKVEFITKCSEISVLMEKEKEMIRDDQNIQEQEERFQDEYTLKEQVQLQARYIKRQSKQIEQMQDELNRLKKKIQEGSK